MGHQYVCLIGNGASIAYNPELSVENLTDKLIERFKDQGGGEAAAALQSLAESAGSPGGTLEHLLGPLDAIANALQFLPDLAQALDQLDMGVKAKISGAESTLRRLHDLGTGTALGLIATLACDRPSSFGCVKTLCEKLAALSSCRPVTVATLNYDGLLHAGFIEAVRSGGLADLSTGYEPDCQSVIAGNGALDCLRLRTQPDFPGNARVHLLNLHGSLSWLRDPQDGRVWKFDLDELRGDEDATSYWDALAAGQARLRPVVVLTNRKSEAVELWPYALAYQVFARRLRCSDRWLIVGYGLGDEPVNAAIRAELARRRSGDYSLPKVLVVDKGDSETVKDRVVECFGLDGELLEVHSGGLEEAMDSSEWLAWGQ